MNVEDVENHMNNIDYDMDSYDPLSNLPNENG
jgi:hypothetical protein